MTHSQLVTAGWITTISAFIAIPLAYLSFRLEGQSDPTSILIQSAMQVFGTILFVAITLYLKKLLNSFFQFHDTNRLINMMIMANSVAGFFVVLSLTFPQLKETMSVAVIIIVMFLGIVQMQFGFKLLKLQSDLGGMLKPFCYSNIATGICIASVVLILAGVVVSAISDLMLATIFFNIAKLIKAHEPNHIDA